jgi:hypothetical protein
MDDGVPGAAQTIRAMALAFFTAMQGRMTCI